jgi:uncharacterized protein
MMETIKITRESGIPLMGAIQFGIIDRGTNLLQIRATTICNLNCPFCSTDAGPNSKTHKTTYSVDIDYLIDWVKEVVKYKGGKNIEANLDSVGEPFVHKDFIELAKKVADIEGIYKISMQSNGTLVKKEQIDELDSIGIPIRINLSIHSTDKEEAKELAGNENYEITQIVELAKYINSKKNIELLLAPVWLPGLNDKGIGNIVELAKELKCLIGIQKYEIYKYSRKMKKAKNITFWKFYKKLEEWEKEHNTQLKLDPKIFKFEKMTRFPKTMDVNQKVYAEIKAPGWIKGQMIGVANQRCVTINKCNKPIGSTAKVKIVQNKNNIYLANQL